MEERPIAPTDFSGPIVSGICESFCLKVEDKLLLSGIALRLDCFCSSALAMEYPSLSTSSRDYTPVISSQSEFRAATFKGTLDAPLLIRRSISRKECAKTPADCPCAINCAIFRQALAKKCDIILTYRVSTSRYSALNRYAF